MKNGSYTRLLACFAAFIMLVSVISGCSTTPNVTQTTTSTDQTTTVADVPTKPASWISDQPLKISWLFSDNASCPYSPNWLVVQQIKKLTNVDVQFQVVPSTDYATKEKLLLNSGDVPDIFSQGSGNESEFMLNGIVVPISDYMDKLPNLSNRISTLKLQSQIENLSMIDGKSYTLPKIEESPMFQCGVAIRLDILSKYNLEVPKTYDDLYDIMMVMKQNDPSSLPLTMFWGLPMVIDFMQPSWGFRLVTGSDNVYYDWDKSSYEASATSPKLQSLLQYLNKCNKDGLFDPEIFTQDLDQWTQKMVSEKSFITFCWSDQLPSINAAGQKNNPDFNLENVLPLSQSSSSDPYSLEIAQVNLGWGIPAADTKKPYFDDLLKFIDWFLYSDEGAMLTNWGVEGQTYSVVDGKNAFSSELLSAANGSSKQAQIQYGLFHNQFIGVMLRDRDLEYVGPKAAVITQQMNDAGMFKAPAPAPKFNVDESEQISLQSAPIKDYVDKSMQAFVQGSMDPTNDWDSFVKAVQDKGIQKIVDLYNSALKR